MTQEAMKLEPCGGCYGSGWITRDPDIGTDQECFVCGGSGACPKEPEQEPVLQEIEQYRLQMAGISTAAIGYWKEGDGIHSAYDTVALRDVAKLYAKYDELYRAQPAQQEPVAIVAVDGIGQIQIGWIKKPQHNDKLYTAPPAQRTWVGLTDDEIEECYSDKGYIFARAIEAKLKEKNT